MKPLAGKIAWITGAGTGIGLAGAQALAKAGATVVMSGRRKEILDDEADKIIAAGGKAEVAPLDVADAAAAATVADNLIERYGRLDILVNAAGLNVPNRAWKNQTVAGWDTVIRTNLDGSYYCIASVLPAMRQQRDGLIINVASWAGMFHTRLTGPAYNASKHGVVAMTMQLNMEECANGIRACALCPGEVATPIMKNRPVPPTPEELARMLQSEDLGQTILWLTTQPAHVCVNEVVISPTWNRLFIAS